MTNFSESQPPCGVSFCKQNRVRTSEHPVRTPSGSILENQIRRPASVGISEGRQILGGVFYTNLFGGLHAKAYIVWAAY